jgi:hypothetical protein
VHFLADFEAVFFQGPLACHFYAVDVYGDIEAVSAEYYVLYVAFLGGAVKLEQLAEL